MAATLQSLERALALLRVVADGPVTSSDCARRTGINRTVVHRILTTLAEHGYVRRDERGYTLGSAVVELAGHVHTDVRARARPMLERLAARTGETAVLTIREGGNAVAIDQVPGLPHLVRVDYRPGFRHPLGRGAHGLAILAHLPPEEAAPLVAGAERPTVLRRRLAEVRRRGWAATRDELRLGTSGAAVPLRAADGLVVASVGVVAPVSRFPDPAALAGGALEAIHDEQAVSGAG